MKKRQNKKIRLIKPELPGGFRDYGPEEARARQNIISTVRANFERFGFEPMETPAVERTEVLTGGEETSRKIIFNIKGSEKKRSEASLRFDLTVPLARFLAANSDIPKPFKRYQIGEVWRGERQQAGRYREFMQIDADIIGVKSLDADAEIIQLMYESMRDLKIDNFFIRINNKREAVELLSSAGVPENKQLATLIAVDKKDKLNPRQWKEEIKKVSGLKEKALKKYLWKISGENSLENTEVRILREKIEKLGVPQKYLIYDASLVRGLGYYTGSVFEMVLTDLPGSSVAGGGRYDGLTARFSRESIPAVGVSIGIDRLFAYLEKLGKIPKRSPIAQVMIMNLSEKAADDYTFFAKNLRTKGISTFLYLGDDRSFQAQLSYAVKKEIPYVLIYGEREKIKNVVTIKNLATREQKEMSKEKIIGYFKQE